MRPPPRSIEEYLYRLLMDSPGFHRWVRKVHAKINRIKLEEFPEASKVKEFDVHTYKPTRWHKINAFRIIWLDEMKRNFKFW
ncbi:uncharacterized protein SPAPADRAFT_143384 [Spathaspora passalidarum NRRL Y-27907]|uniref:Uncharacterized protein n=1 Tax=Spathaspora passalidarum (strain NRRL Y-27907 / 11-Y1) TaxID=619300 RepID=G3AUH8_SPAPN|nr:uncharacterized protein SPAPADRAFT_143384 [Spathaspora passalidarum NRRL Y-27907]EGW30264.1 hypothetical protein SPAPADRAFT_143384 [Spathaspora passalidarum NRRL Y-27907]